MLFLRVRGIFITFALWRRHRRGPFSEISYLPVLNPKSYIDLVVRCPYRAARPACGAVAVDASVLGIAPARFSQEDVSEASRALRSPEGRVRAAFFTLWTPAGLTVGGRDAVGSILGADGWTSGISAGVVFLLDGDLERSVKEASAVIGSDAMRLQMLRALDADPDVFTPEMMSRLYYGALAEAVPVERLMRMAPGEADGECIRSLMVEAARDKVISLLSGYAGGEASDAASRLERCADLEISARRPLDVLSKYGDNTELAGCVADCMAKALEDFLSTEKSAQGRAKALLPARAAMRYAADAERRTRIEKIVASVGEASARVLPPECLPSFRRLQTDIASLEQYAGSREENTAVVERSVQSFVRLKEFGVLRHPEVAELAARYVAASAHCDPVRGGRVAAILSGDEELESDRERFAKCVSREDYEEFLRLYSLSPLCVEARRLMPGPERADAETPESDAPSRSQASGWRYVWIAVAAAAVITLAAVLLRAL